MNSNELDLKHDELEDELRRQRELNTLLRIKCDALTDSVLTLEHTLLSNGNPCPTDEWKVALQIALREKQELASLLRRYQQLAKAYRDTDYKQFLHALDCSFRRRAATEDQSYLKGKSITMGVETTEFIEDSNVEFSEIQLAVEMEDEPLKGDDCHWYRRQSGSSSYLYAGVEEHSAPPARPPTRIVVQYQDSQVETIPSPSTELRPLLALTLIMRGGWLYKYPRRHYTRLISQVAIPTGQLSYRYFWLNPMQSTLVWVAREVKQVKVVEFFTETRKLTSKEQAVVIVILTDQETPLALVPATNDDLAMWVAGLRELLSMRKTAQRWPEDLILGTVNE